MNWSFSHTIMNTLSYFIYLVMLMYSDEVIPPPAVYRHLGFSCRHFMQIMETARAIKVVGPHKLMWLQKNKQYFLPQKKCWLHGQENALLVYSTPPETLSREFLYNTQLKQVCSFNVHSLLLILCFSSSPAIIMCQQCGLMSSEMSTGSPWV